MSYIAIAAVSVVSLATIYGLLQLLRSRERVWERKEREYAAERRDLLNRIMFQSRQTWETPEQPPPVEMDTTEVDAILYPADLAEYS